MPVIPQYERSILPTAETPNVLANPAAMSGGQVSKGIAQVADTVYDFVNTMQERQDNLDLLAIENDAQTRLLKKSEDINQLRGNLAHYKKNDDGTTSSLFDDEMAQLPQLEESIIKDHALSPRAEAKFRKKWVEHYASTYAQHVASKQSVETRQYAVDQIDAKVELAKKLVHQKPDLLPSLIADLKETIKKVYPGSNVDDIAATKIAQIEDQAKASQEGRNVDIAVQNIERKFMKDSKYEGDKVAALAAAGEYLTSPPPEGQDDLPELKDLTPTERERVIRDVDSARTHAKISYDITSNKQSEQLTQEMESDKFTRKEMIAKIDASDLNKADKAHQRSAVDRREHQLLEKAKDEAAKETTK